MKLLIRRPLPGSVCVCVCVCVSVCVRVFVCVCAYTPLKQCLFPHQPTDCSLLDTHKPTQKLEHTARSIFFLLSFPLSFCPSLLCPNLHPSFLSSASILPCNSHLNSLPLFPSLPSAPTHVSSFSFLPSSLLFSIPPSYLWVDGCLLCFKESLLLRP